MEQTMSLGADDDRLGGEGGSWHPALRPEHDPSPPDRTPATPGEAHGPAVDDRDGYLPNEHRSGHHDIRPENVFSFTQAEPEEDQRTSLAQMDQPESNPARHSEVLRDQMMHEVLKDNTLPSESQPTETIPSKPAQTPPSPTLPPIEPPEPPPLQEKILGDSIAEKRPIYNEWAQVEHNEGSFFGAEVQAGEERTGTQHDELAPSYGHKSSNSVGMDTPQKQSTNGDHDFSRGDQDTDDPAWGLARTETDVFKRLKTVDRSNSFPEVPTLPVFQAVQHVEVLPASQAETLAQNQEWDFSYRDDHRELLDEGMGVWDDQLEDPRHSERGLAKSERGFSNELHEEGRSSPTEAESRFEEGLPLVAHKSIEEHPRNPGLEKTIDSFFGDTGAAEDDFFTSNPSNADKIMNNPPALDRKSTFQILGSMDYVPHHPNHHSKGSEATSEYAALPSRQGTGNMTVPATDDLSVSATTLTEYVPSEKPQDKDLNELWKAALGDDELLEDDDEFLPDDEWPESQYMPEDDGPSFEKSMSETYNDNARDRNLSSGQSYLPPTRPGAPRADSSSVSNPYTPHQPSSSAMMQAPYGNFVATQQPPQRSEAPEHAASFADRSREGYQSPYDLPTGFSRPKKKINIQTLAPSPNLAGPLAPPRSSSMIAPAGAPRPAPAVASALGFSPPQPQQPLQGRPPSVAQAGTAPRSPEKTKPRTSSSSFFEELPMVSKPRPSTGMGRYPSQQSVATPLSRAMTQNTASPPTHAPPQQPMDPYAQYQLQPPERLDPYANVPQTVQNAPSPAGSAMRYSPRPPSNNLSQPPTTGPRYSPAPPSTGAPVHNKYVAQQEARPAAQPPPPATRPFQPRTSSPLAMHERNAYQQQPPLIPANIDVNGPGQQSYSQQPVSPDMSRTANDFYSSPQRQNVSQLEYRPGLPSVPSHQAPHRNQDLNQAFPYTPEEPSQPLRSYGAPPPAPSSGYSAQYPPVQSAVDLPFSPPRRSQTQSPGKWAAGPHTAPVTFQQPQRPASVNDPSSPASMNPYGSFPAQSIGRARGLSQNLNFIPPTDGTENDPLQRWRGSAIARFGFGGTLLSTVPKHIPRYISGHTVPLIKSSPGEIRLQPVKDLLPAEDKPVVFPGPLKSKAKKKDVLAWLSSRIEVQERSPWHRSSPGTLPDPQTRHDEKILLWKIMRVMVEFDGHLEANSELQKALSAMISPDLSHGEGTSEVSYAGGSLAGISRSRGSMLQAEPMDPAALESVRKDLLRGDRKKAVWDAVDRRLWAHAMLISSTIDKDIWKQVVQEFVRQEVKLVGENTESLAALYEIFAGNWQESIDELVPPSARAGLQMVSKVVGSGPTKNALDGLNRWRETLALVISNRVPDDHQALAALGNLLAGYGRVEAAHICQLFARSPGLPNCFGGTNDPQASIVLLGADHKRLPLDFARDEDSVLLTEVYEFAVSVLAASPSGTLPYLQAYKLQRAVVLAENGLKNEAQQYCDTIGDILKSTTKMSPYYTPQLFEAVKDLSDRLKQVPSEGSSFWGLSKDMGKVSGSLWGKFSEFVRGDESDGESKGSGKGEGEVGPFAKVVGTPTISRSGSQTDLHGYGSYPVAGQGAPTTSSRYAPGPYAPRSSLEQARSSFEAQRSPPHAPASFSQPPRHETLEPTISNVGGQFAQHASPYQPLSRSPNDSTGMFGYQPTPPQTSHSPMVPADGFHTSASQTGSYQQESYFPTPPNEHSPSFGAQIPPGASPNPWAQPPEPDAPAFNSALNNYEQPSTAYEPPSYTPPSYEPYEPDVQPDTSSPTEEKPKKKSFMDDDDEDHFTSKAVAMQKAEKARKDREADEAFRKAAEADAQKDRPSLQKKPSSWLGGWFGKKDDNIPTTGPIKAKLGEESSFVYDPELKKWINKKDPNSATTAAKSTPPPPRSGPPSRSVSSMAAPASGPPRSISSNLGPPISAPTLQPSTSMPSLSNPAAPTPTPPPGGPPSRTASPLIASPLTAADQTIAPPSGASTPGLAPPSAPTSRPGTSMSNSSSIDDILGAPQARKGGTVKGKKKGRGYVDVMAK